MAVGTARWIHAGGCPTASADRMIAARTTGTIFRPVRPASPVGVMRAGTSARDDSADGRDRPPLGVAHLRRKLRAGRGALRRAGAGTGSGERRALPALARQRRVREDPRRADGREAPRARRRRRARAVDAGDEGGVPARRAADAAAVLDDARDRPGAARARRIHARPAHRRGRRPRPELRAVEVHKRRQHYTIARRMAELSELPTDGATTRTIAVESEDPARCRRRARARARRRPNVSYGRAGSRRSPGSARRFAVIDVGTNSVKFHVGERDPTAPGGRSPTAPRSRGSARASTTRALGAEPIARTADAIAGMVEEAARAGAAGDRGRRHGGHADRVQQRRLVDAVRERTGIEIEVIDGEEEGRLAYLAASRARRRRRIAGRLRHRRGQHPVHLRRAARSTSVQPECRRRAVTERFGLDGVVRGDARRGRRRSPPTSRDSTAARRPSARRDGRGGDEPRRGQHGLATYDPEVVQGSELDRAEIERQIELYRTRDADERREIVGLQPKRAEVILAGACVVRTVLASLERKSLRSATGGCGTGCSRSVRLKGVHRWRQR